MTNKSIINKFACLLMVDGKKSIAFKLLKKSLEKTANKLFISENILLNQVLDNVKPFIDARLRKVGRVSYMIPYAITEKQSFFKAIQIIIHSSRQRREKSFIGKLINEFTDSFKNKGTSIKRKNEIHRLAEANKSFSFFR